MQWSIRNLLNPVITRLLIYGVNPIDVEYVLREVEKKPLVNSHALETTWVSEWEKKATHFIRLGEEARKNKQSVSIREYYMLAAQCYYACYLINSDLVQNKKMIYKKLEACYEVASKEFDGEVEKVKIPMEEGVLPSYLHLPDGGKFAPPYACVIIFAGMGSCKEELNTLARPLVDRGIAVLACDQPGTGAALFDYNIKLSANRIQEAYDRILLFVKEHEQIDSSKLGTYGLCMGGGFAYRMACKYKSIKCCVNLFPLYLSMVEENSIPSWMKRGSWAEFQIGKVTIEDFYKEMEYFSEGAVTCDYLLVHSKFDNWMHLEETMKIYNKSLGYKEHVMIEDEPVYATKEVVTHAMPVGEQMHWVKHQAADWIVAHIL